MWRQGVHWVGVVTGMFLMLRSEDCRVLWTSEFWGDVKKRITSCLLCNTAVSCVGRRNHWLTEERRLFLYSPSIKQMVEMINQWNTRGMFCVLQKQWLCKERWQIHINVHSHNKLNVRIKMVPVPKSADALCWGSYHTDTSISMLTNTKLVQFVDLFVNIYCLAKSQIIFCYKRYQ